jgi:hypothetical protein
MMKLYYRMTWISFVIWRINGLFMYETKGETLAHPTAATFGLGSLPKGKSCTYSNED